MKTLLAFFHVSFGLFGLVTFAGLLALTGFAAISAGWQAGLAVLLFGFPLWLVIGLACNLFIWLFPLR
jgi:hypothetical protein